MSRDEMLTNKVRTASQNLVQNQIKMLTDVGFIRELLIICVGKGCVDHHETFSSFAYVALMITQPHNLEPVNLTLLITYHKGFEHYDRRCFFGFHSRSMFY